MGKKQVKLSKYRVETNKWLLGHIGVFSQVTGSVINIGGADSHSSTVGITHKELFKNSLNFFNLDVYKSPNVNIVADATAIPFVDNYVDAVLCVAVLEHVKHYTKVLYETKRVLRNGMFAYFVVPSLFRYHASDRCRDYNRWYQSGIVNDMENTGFKVIESSKLCKTNILEDRRLTYIGCADDINCSLIAVVVKKES